MIRNANRNTAAFDRWMNDANAPAPVAAQPVKVARFPLWLAVMIGAAALALPVAQIAGLL